ncbi:hypothetical protein [Fulvitalea axinellae]|uniref:hypothetical protein n=1 Tax=Fulvitalea axinellae TaxID=1182444 RepID=UPI0030CA2E1E
MKQISTISLILSLLVFTLSKQGAVLLTFNIFQQYIADNLCENRDRPMTMCYGNCFLEKELNKTTEQEEQRGIADETSVSLDLYSKFTSVSNPEKPVDFISKKGLIKVYSNAYHFLWENSLFHPPRT